MNVKDLESFLEVAKDLNMAYDFPLSLPSGRFLLPEVQTSFPDEDTVGM